MTPSARLQATAELLEAIDTTPRPADAIVSGYFRARRYIGSKDRGAISSLTYDILRHQARLNWWLEKFNIEKTSRFRLLAYLNLVENKSAQLLVALCDGKKFSFSPLSQPERSFLNKLEGHTTEHPSMPDTVKGECPPWAESGLQKRFGNNFSKELKALLNPAPLDLRVNTLKTTREKALEILQKNGLKAEACRLSQLGIRLYERPALDRILLLREGLVEIQDEGSQLVAQLVDAKPGLRVVDFCAGAGGKTLAIAAQMQNKGRITACDVLENRLKRSTERFRRAGFHNIEVKPLTSENDPWVKKHKCAFDRVLVDAPCSGTGTWRRNPDSRWRSLGPGLDALLPLQAQILKSAARLVKAGGRLIYATCSLLVEENENQIEFFLSTNPEFMVIPVSTLANLPVEGPYLTLSPAQHDTDGFFCAILERKQAAI